MSPLQEDTVSNWMWVMNTSLLDPLLVGLLLTEMGVRECRVKYVILT